MIRVGEPMGIRKVAVDGPQGGGTLGHFLRKGGDAPGVITGERLGNIVGALEHQGVKKGAPGVAFAGPESDASLRA